MANPSDRSSAYEWSKTALTEAGEYTLFDDVSSARGCSRISSTIEGEREDQESSWSKMIVKDMRINDYPRVAHAGYLGSIAGHAPTSERRFPRIIPGLFQNQKEEYGQDWSFMYQ
jgi:hypothetical protein